MRWLWIDRFVEFKSGQSARAVKNLSLAEDLFRDHFPDYPVMPAALMLDGHTEEQFTYLQAVQMVNAAFGADYEDKTITGR